MISGSKETDRKEKLSIPLGVIFFTLYKLFVPWPKLNALVCMNNDLFENRYYCESLLC